MGSTPIICKLYCIVYMKFKRQFFFKYRVQNRLCGNLLEKFRFSKMRGTKSIFRSKKIRHMLQNIQNGFNENGSFYARVLLAARQFRFFYGGLLGGFFKQVCLRVGQTKRKETNIFCLLEFRIQAVLYRINFSKTMYHAKQLLLSNIVLVNYRIIFSVNFFLHIGDFVCFSPKKKIKFLILDVVCYSLPVEMDLQGRHASMVNFLVVDYIFCAFLVSALPEIDTMVFSNTFSSRMAFYYLILLFFLRK